jgi:formylglycine-generating enzyme required for sulfatase activity
MVWVGGGTFRSGADNARYYTVGAFWFGRTEVTRGAYARCVIAGVCEPARGPSAGNPAAGTPVVGVTYSMAERYCGYLGGRLPTRAEWEFAARGADGWRYPWGEHAPDCTVARFAGCGAGPVRAGTLRAGASPFGALEMAGNVAEWTQDRGGATAPAGSACDPTGPRVGRTRMTCGGAFDAPAALIRPTACAERDPDEARYDTGFRCLRTGL